MLYMYAVLLSSFIVGPILLLSVCGYSWLPRIAFLPSIIIDRYLNLSVVFLTSIRGPRIARKLGSIIVFSSLNITRKFNYSEN